MQVIHWGRARKFFQKHPEAETPLKNWRMAVQKADWRNFPDVKATFNTADWVAGQVVFDIKGNEFRLVAFVRFEKNRIFIRDVLTHAEYDKGDWKR
jgi:mRNA interferase HigB